MSTPEHKDVTVTLAVRLPVEYPVDAALAQRLRRAVDTLPLIEAGRVGLPMEAAVAETFDLGKVALDGGDEIIGLGEEYSLRMSPFRS